MLAVDTNVLVYAADIDSQFHVPCRNWLERRLATGCLVFYLANPVRVFTRDNPPTGHATAVERPEGDRSQSP